MPTPAYILARERAAREQKEKDAKVQREQEEKLEKDKQRAKAELEEYEAAKEARRLELLRANESLNKTNGGNGASHEFDMFAEDERPKLPSNNSALKLVGSAKASKGDPPSRSATTARAGPSRPRTQTKASNGSSSASTKNGGSPPPLGRKERAARAFAQQALKGAKGDSAFSVRNLVDSREGGSGGSSPRAKPAKSQPSINPHMVKYGINQSKGRGGALKAQMNKAMQGEGMRILQPDRNSRDKRTIDQIHSDIKSRKAALNPAPSTSTSASASSSTAIGNGAERAKPKFTSIPTTARPVKADSKSPIRKPKHRARSPSSSSTSSYESDRPRKRRRDEELDEPSQAHISAQIQAMFRRPGTAQRRYQDEISDDGSSDMEAGLSDVEQEEKRTAAIARREDQLAEEEEKARKLAKERAKKEKMKGK